MGNLLLLERAVSVRNRSRLIDSRNERLLDSFSPFDINDRVDMNDISCRAYRLNFPLRG